MNGKGSVVIGIVTRNRADIVPRAIRSALAQGDVRTRVAVIDDGSTDSTPDLAQEFKEVEWITWPQSRGYLQARNHWMRESTEEYFVSLDDDAWFLRGDEIAIASSLLDKAPRIGAIAFDILSHDRPLPVDRSDPTPVPIFVGCGHVVRLSATREVGLYEPTPCSYAGEEKDLCLRLMDAGYEIVKLPGVHVWHDKTSTARDFAAQYESGVCNDFFITYRRTPTALLPLALTAKIFQHLRGGIQRGLLKAAWRGFSQFATSLPAQWRTRRPIKASTLREFARLGRA